VEHNKFCVSVHFRNCQADQYDRVLAAVEGTLREHEELHATRGRKVFEIRPQARPCRPWFFEGHVGGGSGRGGTLGDGYFT
jgi:trehalose 6-phosphate phosphatase